MLVLEGRLPEEEQTLTMRPKPRCAMSGAAVRINRIGASTLSSHWRCQSSSVSSSSERAAVVPALLTRASVRPNSAARRDHLVAGVAWSVDGGSVPVII